MKLTKNDKNSPSTGNVKQSVGISGVSSRKKYLVILFVVSFLLYANTINNGFVLDDGSVTIANSYVKNGVAALPQIFTTAYRQGFEYQTEQLYRPLSVALFAIEYSVFGGNASVFHLCTILIYVACILLLFLFLDLLFDKKQTYFAFIVSILFSFHPIHTEVVANIKSCDELLCFLFATCSLIFFIKFINNKTIFQLLAGCCSLFLSLLAKETSVTYLAVIPILFFFYKNENKRSSVLISISVIFVFFAYFVLRHAILKDNATDHATETAFIDNYLVNPGISYATRLATTLLILGYNLKLLLIPYPLVCDYSFNAIPYGSFTDLGVIISVLVYVFLLLSAVYGLFKKKKNVVSLGLIFYFVTISIFSNLFVTIGSNMAERFLFFPSLGFCIIAGHFFHKTGSPAISLKKLNLNLSLNQLFLLLVLSLFAFITVQRNNEWKDNYTLFSNDIQKSPNSARINRAFAIELAFTIVNNETDKVKKRQLREEAIGYLQKAIAIYPDFQIAHTELGLLYFKTQQYQPAIAEEKIALRLNRNDTVAINTLAETYFNAGQFRDCIETNKIALLYDKNKAAVTTHIAASFGLMNQFDSAIHYLTKAIEIDPDYPDSYQNLAIIYQALNHEDSAAKYAIVYQNKKAQKNK